MTESESQKVNIVESKKKDGNFEPWMIVERKARRKSRDNMLKSTENKERDKDGSRFGSLENRDLIRETQNRNMADLRKSKRKGILIEDNWRKELGSQINVQAGFNKGNSNSKTKELGLKNVSGPIIKKNKDFIFGLQFGPHKF